jgi:hypothetical protein
MLERLAKGFLVSLTTMVFVVALPFLLTLLLIPSLPPDDRWFLKMAFTFLGPFSAVLWFIAFSHFVLRRRAGYFPHWVRRQAISDLRRSRCGDLPAPDQRRVPPVKITRAAFVDLFGVHLPKWFRAAWAPGTNSSSAGTRLTNWNCC